MTNKAPKMSERETLCPFCGAHSSRACELEKEMGVCPWEESKDDEAENDEDNQ